jgi:DNA polymerase-3 subunit epsilon
VKLTRPLVVIDLESTGVDPITDRIVEFGCVVLRPDGTRHSWESRFNPGRPIPKEASDVHGITDEMVAHSPVFKDHAARIHRGLQDRDIAGYNLRSFDLPMLDEELRRCGLKLELTGINIIDAFGIYQKKDPRTLEAAVRKYCGRPHEGAHGAMADALATLDVIHGQLAAHEDLEAMELPALAQFSQRSDQDFVDLAGKLYRDAEGFVRYAFGKSKDARIADDPGFARWMLGKDFAGNTLDCVKAELRRLGS